MARSQASEVAQTSSEVADSEAQADAISADEQVSVSNKSPAMPSSSSSLPKNPRNHGSDDDPSFKDIPIKIVGEATENGKKYYYAERGDGVVHRVPTFAPQFPHVQIYTQYSNLVKDYNRKVKDGTLSDFDPSTSVKVHPSHRLTIRLKPSQFIKTRAGKARPTSTRSSTVTKPSSDDDDDALIISSDDSDSDAAPVRHSTRIANLPKPSRPNPRPLRNLRSRGKAGSEPSSDVEPDSGSAYSVDDDNSSDDSSKQKLPKIRIKRAPRQRNAIQGLGIIRPMSEGEESDSEAEGIYLRRHRGTCD
ncbi:hypothetical protein FRC09_019725, partial [Ceratobasidium sp. 395]